MRVPALAAALAAAPTVLAGVQEVWWNITFVNAVNPDGLFPRRAIGVNGTWPPPPVSVSTNDSLILHATNSLDAPTTLHHHGMFFNSSSWMDGAQGVSECGIPPGGTFDYVVPINESGQWGTYWVHAHASGHYVDGLRAPLVINPEKEVHTYDDEFTVVLGDWYHQEHQVLLKKFINVANPGGAEPVPDAPLIYFVHNNAYLAPVSGTSTSTGTPGVGFNENTTLPFVPGKTYRLRIVNTSAFSMFFFWIDGHDMRIIEVDGTDVEESPIDLISITAAQRYSVLITARNDTSANWAVHANMDTDMFDTVPDTLNPNATSSITYSPSSPLQNLSPIAEYHDVDDLSLAPIPAIPQYPPASRTIELEVSFDTMDDGTNHAMFNQVTYNPPLVPAVFSEMTLGPNATVASAYGPQSFVLEQGEVVDLVVKNGDAGNILCKSLPSRFQSGYSPMRCACSHLHGHKYQIVSRSTDYTSDDPSLNPALVEGQKNPVRRDTIQIPSMNSATLRFVADNPGAWFFHCHIEWHLQVGLAIQLLEAPLAAQQLQSRIPPIMYDHCKSLDHPISGNAAGHASPTDLSGLPLGPFPQKLGWHQRGIGAMAGCVLAAVLGMATVVWYALGGGVTDEEIERELREKMERKERRGKWWKRMGKPSA